jgi:hypothetical protein
VLVQPTRKQSSATWYLSAVHPYTLKCVERSARSATELIRCALLVLQYVSIELVFEVGHVLAF